MKVEERIGLTFNEEKALLDFKRRLKNRFGDILIAIKLFGSRARGDAHPGSDIDLLVILRERNKEMDDILVETICEILNIHGVYFEVVSYSYREYEQSKRRQWPFVLNLEREAILI